MHAALTTLILAPHLSGGSALDAEFEAPAQLTHGGEAFAKMIYPTPVLFDVDGDQTVDLVVGDLIGRIHVCAPVGEDDDTRWTKSQQLQANGKPLKLNNW